MIPARIEHDAPDSVEEALTTLERAGDEAKVLAGGQSLLPVLRMRLNAPGLLVDLSRIETLHGIRDEGDEVVIGAMTTYQGTLDAPTLREHLLLLPKAVETVADPQIRHRGTLGGALAHADPAGDVGTTALTLDATFEITGASGKRTV